MISKPKIISREKQNFVSIKIMLNREEIPKLLPPLIPELFNWLDSKNIEPSGPPFFSYVKLDGEKMEVRVGIPTDDLITTDNRVESGYFPEGKYVKLEYTGNYGDLYFVNGEFEKWAEKKGIKFTGPRTEFYPSDPEAEPDPEKQKTILINRISEENNPGQK